MTEKPKSADQIRELEQFLPEATHEELVQILEYGEKIKAEGERKKDEWRHYYNRLDFLELLKYKWKYKIEIEGNYKYLDKMQGLEREKFIEEYLYNDMLYSGKILEKRQMEGKTYSYEDWKKQNVIMEEGTELFCAYIGEKGAIDIAKNMELTDGIYLNLSNNEIGPKGAKIIAKNLKLKEGVTLNLNDNQIGDEGVKVISEYMQLKNGVCLRLQHNQIGDEGANAIAENLTLKDGTSLDLSWNQIGDEGAKAIAENLELRDGVYLDLSKNQIGDEGAKAIVENLELRDGVYLDLGKNQIGYEMRKRLKELEESYHARGIYCKILVS